VLAIAERVNRKVQILRLHWQAARIHEDIDVVYHDLGNRLCEFLPHACESLVSPVVAGRDAEMVLLDSIGKIRVLKQELVGVDTLVQELEIETLREDLVTLQHDLSNRSALIRRVVVQPDGLANRRSVVQLELPSTVRIAAVLRGPLLMPSVEQLEFKAGDVVVLVGPRAAVQQSLPFFSPKAPLFS
ncbi:MAG: TrkA C-terminal domain-containing protein, partial [Nitrospiraceae bacterium]